MSVVALSWPSRGARFAMAMLLVGCGGQTITDPSPAPAGSDAPVPEDNRDAGPHEGACLVAGETHKYLFAIALSKQPTHPFLGLVEIELLSGDPVSFKMNWSIQMLKAADRKTPTGLPTSFGPIQVSSAGEFTANLPQFTIPADASPIFGSHTIVSLELTGTYCSSTPFSCGSVDGAVVKPSPLVVNGSSWTLARVHGGPDSYDEPPRVDCVGTLAEPLSETE